MGAEPPEQFTPRVWQMLADARTCAMTREEATEQASRFLRRNLGYLARRARRGPQTNYDELLVSDLEAIGRMVVRLQPSRKIRQHAKVNLRSLGNGLDL